jgi:hypothetical protein
VKQKVFLYCDSYSGFRGITLRHSGAAYEIPEFPITSQENKVCGTLFLTAPNSRRLVLSLCSMFFVFWSFSPLTPTVTKHVAAYLR